MTSKGLTELIFIEGSVTCERYANDILPKLINVKSKKKETNDVTTTKLFDYNNNWIFEQDYAKSHDSSIAQKFMINVPFFFNKNETPEKLDDLWCIERICAVMIYKMYAEGHNQPKSLSELKNRIKKAWKSLDAKLLKRAVHQMPLRMKEIIFKKG